MAFLAFNFFLSLSLLGAEDEILGLPFFQKHKNCLAQKNTLFLDDTQKKALEKEIGHDTTSRLIQRYSLNCQNRLSEVYFLTDQVRSHYQTLLLWVEQQQISHLEILRFDEPARFKPSPQWVKQFVKNSSGEINAITGATLTTRSTKKLVKMALALDKLFGGKIGQQIK